MSKRRVEIARAKDLSGNLGVDDVFKAGEVMRMFEASPAWYRLQQLLEKQRVRYEETIYRKPQMMNMTDYAEAAGALNMIDTVYDSLTQIIEEAAKERE